MEQYDFIIAGGGAAGLGLAYQLTQSPLHDRSILVVDIDAKDEDDRTWCSWVKEPSTFDAIAYRSWNALTFVGTGFRRTFETAPYRYRMIRGIDFYRFTRETLKARPNVTLLQGHVDALINTDDGVTAIVDGNRAFNSAWAFDSRYQAETFAPRPGPYHHLWQHFKGWVIKTPDPVFDPERATLFDFRTPQEGAMRFFYILPHTPRRGLVEYTLFSPHLLSEEAYDDALRAYIRDVLNVNDFQIEEVEQNRIPMTDQPFPRRSGERILTTGTRGGRVKASSGYAFLRIQQDAAAIVRSLTEHGDPFHLPTAPSRYKTYDAVMLDVMERHGDDMASIFTQMFQRNSIQRIFRFLDEENTLWDDLRLMTSLPLAPFLASWLRVQASRMRRMANGH